MHLQATYAQESQVNEELRTSNDADKLSVDLHVHSTLYTQLDT